jgi:hypothetical protein
MVAHNDIVYLYLSHTNCCHLPVRGRQAGNECTQVLCSKLLNGHFSAEKQKERELLKNKTVEKEVQQKKL